MYSVWGAPEVFEETCPRHPFAVVLGAREGLLALSGQQKQSSPPAGETLGRPRRAWQVWKSAIAFHHSCIGSGRWAFRCALGEAGRGGSGARLDSRPGTSAVCGETGSVGAVGQVLGRNSYYRYFLSMWLVHCTTLEDRDEDAGGVARRATHASVRCQVGSRPSIEAYPSVGGGWPLPSGVVEAEVWHACHYREHPAVLPAGASLVLRGGIGGRCVQPGVPSRVGGTHPVVGHVKVVRTWGVHPKALDDVDWSWLEGKMASPDCVAIGECRLDDTAPNMAHQEDAFKRQIEKARQLKKPLVLHLRGRNPNRMSAIYGQALALTSSILPRKHQVYLHSFSATQAEYKLWHRAFPNLLVGCSWLTAADINCWPMLRMIHTESLALETDSPHLAPRIGWINSTMRIWAQAEMVAEVRNVPVSTLLECSHPALRQFYSL